MERNGGHMVPEEDVRRRYRRGLRNSLDTYRMYASAWTVFDNASVEPQVIVTCQDGVETVADCTKYKLLQDTTAHEA